MARQTTHKISITTLLIKWIDAMPTVLLTTQVVWTPCPGSDARGAQQYVR